MKIIKTAAYYQSSGSITALKNLHEEVEASKESEEVPLPNSNVEAEQVQEKRLNRFRSHWYGAATRPKDTKAIIR